MQWKILPVIKKLSSHSFKKDLFLISLISSFLFPVGTSALFESTVSEAELISSVEGVGNHNTIWVGLDIHLKPGWKTYWRTPGAAGYSLKIDWAGSKNLKSVETYWPSPVKFETFKMIANGYKEEVILPIQVVLQKLHSPLLLKGKLDYLACDSGNCIPQSKSVTLSIPNKPDLPSINAKKIIAATNQIPEDHNSDFDIKYAQFIQNKNTASYLRLTVFHKFPLLAPEIFIEGPKHLFFDKMLSMTTTDVRDGQLSTIDIPIYKNEKKELIPIPNLIGKQLTITLENGNKSIEKTISVTPPPLSVQDTFIMYGVALLGGFILNFMPCVLPVILLKIFSLTKYSGKKIFEIREALFLSVLGIMTSFMILAIIPISLGFLGISFGWGMQFQEPVFLVFMMVILTLFTANFWGLYEILLPERMTSLGNLYSSKEGNLGHFLTGMFTTLLATPCSAPYLGTAISFALSRGSFEILLIFFFISIGLAFPLILIMIFPKLVAYFPKPGSWMNIFKHIVGWAFFITMLWLFYVLTSQIPLLSALFILGIMLSILLVFWLGKAFPQYKRGYIFYGIFAPLLLAVSLFVVYAKKEPVISQEANIQQTLDTIRSSVKQGKTVFVDVSADWCLTCKANEFLVLKTNTVQNMMKANGVVFLTIDWTSKDPKVYEYLKSFNHNGIPFYAVYGPRIPYGHPLPQILTSTIINNALKEAKY